MGTIIRYRQLEHYSYTLNIMSDEIIPTQEDMERAAQFYMMFSIGMGVCRTALKILVNSKDPDSGLIHESGKFIPFDREEALKKVDSIIDFTDSGRFEVRFGQRRAFLSLEECDKNHDLDAELSKIRDLVPKWDIVLATLSQLIYIGRSTYAKLSRENASFFEEYGLPQAFDLKVDTTNTTLYLEENASRRIGIFVTLE